MIFLQTLVVALVAGAAGGVAAAFARNGLKRRSGPQRPDLVDALRPLLDQRNSLVRDDIFKVSALLTRVHEDVSLVLQQGGTGASTAAAGPSASRREQPMAGLETYDRPPTWCRDEDPAGRMREPGRPPIQRFERPSDRPFDPPPTTSVEDRSPAGRELGLVAEPYADPDGWEGTGVPSGPPANAPAVEARDDRIVVSPSYPPEAWLEPGSSPTQRRLYLNPSVALTDYALRRLSTFFEWEAERPGVGYRTLRPATIQWDEGQRVGKIVDRGKARPL